LLNKPELHWEEIVEYSFLSEFDLLRDARQDIRSCPWATPAGRHALDTYFKIQGARNEIQRLDVEIKQLITQMQDEERFLRRHIDLLSSVNPLLAHQIFLYSLDRARFNDIHRQRLHRLSSLPGFSGNLIPGCRLLQDASGWVVPATEEPIQPNVTTPAPLNSNNPDDDEDHDEEHDGLAEAEVMIRILGD
jgi:hypothetical protein